VLRDDVERFGRGVAAHLEAQLGTGLVGAWFVGSIALGGYVPGESDVDIVAVAPEGVAEDVKRAIADDLLELAPTCPARGLELTLYRLEVATSLPEGADFEVNVNGGPRMPTSVHLDPRSEPGFWYVLDRAIAHRCGVAITGAPAREVFADAPRQTLLGAMVESMRWHRRHERATLYSVLNACRAWRYAAEGVLGSKLDGAAWARDRWRRPELVDAAVELRQGGGGQLHEGEVDELLDHVESALADQHLSAARHDARQEPD
jgi:hypothetical protein